MKPAINIFWFRRDLRLHDNAGLYHALKDGNPNGVVRTAGQNRKPAAQGGGRNNGPGRATHKIPTIDHGDSPLVIELTELTYNECPSNDNARRLKMGD